MTEETKAKKPAKASKPAKSGKMLRVKQVRSAAGRFAYQEATLVGLGLNKINRTKELQDTPEIRGMIRAVQHLVEVEEIAA